MYVAKGERLTKADDFTQLNEKFIKARRDYEMLLESSMSHPPQPTYGRPAYTYGGPPPQSQTPAGGYAPQGQQPDQRYYSPGPAEPQYPPQGGPQPFYFIPPSQQGQVPARGRTPSNPNASTDDLYSAPPARTNANDPRRQTIAFDPRTAAPGGAIGGHVGGPQELATGSFDSPVDNRHSYMGAPPQQGTPQPGYDYAPRPFSPETSKPLNAQPSDPYSQAPVDSYQAQGAPTHAIHTLPSQQQRIPQQPSAPPPSVPTNAGSPVYQAFGTGYQAYQPPGAGGAPPAAGGGGYGRQPVGAAGASASEEGFYR